MDQTLLNLQDLAKQVLDLLDRKELNMASAESATGGLASHILTNVPGCSKHYLGGVVCYTVQAKNTLLDVDFDLINDYGTVSPEVTEALLVGLQKMGADVTFSVTGVAGSQLEGKAPGTMYIGIGMNGNNRVHDLHFSGSRIEIKEQTVAKVFELIIQELEKL